MVNELEGSPRNRELQELLLRLSCILQDGQTGCAQLGEQVHDPALRRSLLAESLRRASLRAALEAELLHSGMQDVQTQQSLCGRLLLAWGGLGALLGADDHALLGVAEAGEREAVQAFAAALQGELPTPIRELLEAQHNHLRTTLAWVQQQRSSAQPNQDPGSSAALAT